MIEALTIDQILDEFRQTKLSEKSEEYLNGDHPERRQAATAAREAGLRYEDCKRREAEAAETKTAREAEFQRLARQAGECKRAVSARLAEFAEVARNAPESLDVVPLLLEQGRLQVFAAAVSKVAAEVEEAYKLETQFNLEMDLRKGDVCQTTADLLDQIVVEECAIGVALQGTITLDRQAGLSGELRRRAAAYYASYRERMAEWTRKNNKALES